MKLSINWLKRYLDLPYSASEIGEMLTLIGLETEGIEQVEAIRGGLKGVVTGEVLKCWKHPDADKLSVTEVSTGDENTLQIVCGAPNVAEGQKVLVATVGTRLYIEDKELVIKKGKIRGVESQGMICAEDELGLGRDHSGIMVLPQDTQVGLPAAQLFDLEDDYVLEIGLTPNRSDATSQLGVARDLLAYLKVNKSYDKDISEPEVSGFITEKSSVNIQVELENKSACKRYAGLTLTHVQVQESPEWLKKLLKAIDVKPINNIVDITNFILHEYGQPLHAFDADKINGGKIRVKNLASGTLFTTLDGSERKIHEEDLMICDGDSQPLCMAGVYGGLHSGVTAETKNIFLESAYFDPGTIRRTSTRHNLRTDAARIFEKGADPNIAVTALKRAAALMREWAHATISDQMVDIYPAEIHPAELRLYYHRVNKLIGTDIPTEDIHNILMSMNMTITPVDRESIIVKVPTNKCDVTREVDLIEEIVRIYGLNRIPMPSRISSTVSHTEKPEKYPLKEQISGHLTSNGFNEIMGLSLVESQLYKDITYMSPDNFVFINNTSNIHLDIMRPDMLISGLISVVHNHNRQQNQLQLFEFGKSYLKNGDTFAEKEFFSIFMSGKKFNESWLEDSRRDKSFYDIKRITLSALNSVGIRFPEEEVFENEESLTYGIRLRYQDRIVAVLGEVQPTLCKQMGLKSKIFFAQLAFDDIIKAVRQISITTREISRYPSVRRDLALVIPRHVTFRQIEEAARSVDKRILKQIGLFDVYESKEQLGPDKKSYAVSFTFENTQKTLNDKEIDFVMGKLTAAFESQMDAVIRK
jgi:phenylalanyl-tRNA synthetase beta chain